MSSGGLERILLGLKPVRQQQSTAEPNRLRRAKKKAARPPMQQVYIDPVDGSVRVLGSVRDGSARLGATAGGAPATSTPAAGSYLDRVANKHGVWTHGVCSQSADADLDRQHQPRPPPKPQPQPQPQSQPQASMSAQVTDPRSLSVILSGGGSAAATAVGGASVAIAEDGAISCSPAAAESARAAEPVEIQFCESMNGGKSTALKFCPAITREELAAASSRARREAATAAAREVAAAEPTAAPGARQRQPKPASHVASCTCGACRRKRKLRPTGGAPVRYHRGGVPLVTAIMEASGLKATTKSDWNVMWTLQHLKAYHFKALQRHQFVNQFPRTHECCNKSSLARNVSRMGTVHGAKHFDFVPRTFVLPKERDMFHQEWERCRRDAMGGESVPWMVKPASAACGRGIYITEEFDDCPTEGLDEFVVSRYIPNPLLINGIKFDLRIYVAVSSFNPLTIYVYEEGLARFATEKYNHGQYDNSFVHLTNYSINKKSAKFVQNGAQEDFDESACKWSFAQLRERLSSDGIDCDALWARIEDVIVKTLISVEAQVNTACDMHVPYAKNCLELFGFDVLIDDHLKPWLLEVNFSPSLACDSELDLGIKAGVIANCLTLMGVRLGQHNKQVQQQHSLGVGKAKGKRAPRERGEGGSVSYARLDLTPEEKRVVRDLEEETARSGLLKRIFPSRNSFQYRKFFEEERPLNTMLANYCFARGEEQRGSTGGEGSIAMQQARDQRRREVQQRLERGPPTTQLEHKHKHKHHSRLT